MRHSVLFSDRPANAPKGGIDSYRIGLTNGAKILFWRRVRCERNFDCGRLRRNFTRGKICRNARRTINDECFRGGDDGHRIALEDEENGMIRCK